MRENHSPGEKKAVEFIHYSADEKLPVFTAGLNYNGAFTETRWVCPLVPVAAQQTLQRSPRD